jgi:hypothetical protein
MITLLELKLCATCITRHFWSHFVGRIYKFTRITGKSLVLWGDEAKRKRGIVMKNFWILPFLILLIIVISVIVMDGKRTIHSKEDCEDESIPCVKAISSINKVKVLNGTSSFEDNIEKGTSMIIGDVSLKDLEKKFSPLKVEKEGLVTLEFVNQTPTNLSVSLLEDNKRSAEVVVDQNSYSFNAPEKTGTYLYEIYCEYENAKVYHYLKVKVK